MLDLIKKELFINAVNALKSTAYFRENITLLPDEDVDETFDAGIRILDVNYFCIIEENVNFSNLNFILSNIIEKTGHTTTPVLLVTRYINTDLLNRLVAKGISVIDAAGNFFIQAIENGQLKFQMSNTGRKNTCQRRKNYPIFLEAGIKVIFYLLNDFENVQKPYREIQNATGVSIGSIKNIIDELVSQNFVLKTERGRFLKNEKTLLGLWTIAYNQILKPTILLARMSFRDSNYRNRWLAMELPEGMYWGGESAANMVVPYLEPGKYDIYTDIPSANLMRTGFVKPDTEGEICIYQKFWRWDNDVRLVPLVLVYADLMGSGDDRCIETAQMILNNGLKHFK